MHYVNFSASAHADRQTCQAAFYLCTFSLTLPVTIQRIQANEKCVIQVKVQVSRNPPCMMHIVVMQSRSHTCVAIYSAPLLPCLHATFLTRVDNAALDVVMFV